MLIALVFPFLPREFWLPAVAFAAGTEFLDGWIARRWNCETMLGRQMDPVADKMFVLAVGYTFYAAQILTISDILLIVARDLMVLVGGLLAWAFGLGRDFLVVHPRLSGKIATTVQFVLLLAIAAWQTLEPWLLWITVAVSLGSAADYFLLGINRLRIKWRGGSGQ
jgi:cardiolipin synthase